jgi:GNAT superfamily N-acetyltransferase
VPICVVPANRASWRDLQTVFGTNGDAAECQCQWFKVSSAVWRTESVGARAAALRAQTRCGNPAAHSTSGLVGYLDDEPVGWCAVEPRTAYVRLLAARIPWAGRDEDKNDDRVWAVTCFVTRAGYRSRGVSRTLAAAAVDFARERGARAVEGYPVDTEPGRKYSSEELYHGTRAIFAAAGFRIVSAPTARRLVMRIDF